MQHHVDHRARPTGHNNKETQTYSSLVVVVVVVVVVVEVVVRTDDLTHEFILARQWMHLIMVRGGEGGGEACPCGHDPLGVSASDCSVANGKDTMSKPQAA